MLGAFWTRNRPLGSINSLCRRGFSIRMLSGDQFAGHEVQSSAVERILEMKLITVLLGVGLATICNGAQAELLTLEVHAVVGEFFQGFEGGDRFPFVGLERLDGAFFQVQYDTDLEPVLIDGMAARYELDAAGSSLLLGESLLSFDTATLQIGTNSAGNGFVSFSGQNDEHGTRASFSMFGLSPMSMDLPRSLDLAQFSLGNDFSADSVDNQLLLPIAFGGLNSVAVVPAPGSMLVLVAGALATTRRRRDRRD